MKRFIAFIFTVFCVANSFAQGNSAETLISRLSEQIRSKENYEVEIEVKSGDQNIKGY